MVYECDGSAEGQSANETGDWTERDAKNEGEKAKESKQRDREGCSGGEGLV